MWGWSACLRSLPAVLRREFAKIISLELFQLWVLRDGSSLERLYQGRESRGNAGEGVAATWDWVWREEAGGEGSRDGQGGLVSLCQL